MPLRELSWSLGLMAAPVGYFAMKTRKYWCGRKVCSLLSRRPLASICLIKSSRAIFICRGGPKGSSFFVEVDHDDLAAGFEHLFHQREIFRLILDMVPDVADEEAIDRLVRQQRIVQVGEDGDDVGRFGFADAPVDVADHVGADVDGEDFAFIADMMGWGQPARNSPCRRRYRRWFRRA